MATQYSIIPEIVKSAEMMHITINAANKSPELLFKCWNPYNMKYEFYKYLLNGQPFNSEIKMISYLIKVAEYRRLCGVKLSVLPVEVAGADPI